MSKISKLTLGEIAWVERFTNSPIDKIGDTFNAPTLIALVTVYKKREDPNFTAQDAETWTADEANEFLGLNEDEDDAGEAQSDNA